MAQEQLARLRLEGSERTLDIGCGDGKITAQVAARVPRGSVLGVDPSQNMIAFARSHFGPSVRPNLRFESGDARCLTYREEFDLVVSFNALHWVPDQAAALRSIRAALKPTGWALLRFVPEGRRKSLEDVVEDVRCSARWADYFRDLVRPYAHSTPEEYRALTEQNGLRVLRMQTEDEAWDFKTRDAFAAWCRAGLVEWMRLLPESDWQAFIADVLARYQFVAADGPQEANTFKFYQMEVVLAPAQGQL
jgi:trans-aconitate methyltransferase